MPPKNFRCKKCGNCCLNLSDADTTCATEEDYQRWMREGRDDILEWIDDIPMGNDQFVHDIWINPKTGDDVSRCPWLRKIPDKNKYACKIHNLKPEHCRNYPKSRKHAIETGCIGFEV